MLEEPRPPYGIPYRVTKGVDAFVRHVLDATPMQMVQIERAGVSAAFVRRIEYNRLLRDRERTATS